MYNYSASTVMAPAERSRLDTLLEVVQRQVTPLQLAAPVEAIPVLFPVPMTGTRMRSDEDDSKPPRLPTGPGSPTRAKRHASKRRDLGRAPILQLTTEPP